MVLRPLCQLQEPLEPKHQQDMPNPAMHTNSSNSNTVMLLHLLASTGLQVRTLRLLVILHLVHLLIRLNMANKHLVLILNNRSMVLHHTMARQGLQVNSNLANSTVLLQHRWLVVWHLVLSAQPP